MIIGKNIRVAMFALFLCFAVFILIIFYFNNKQDMSVINYIESQQTGHNSFKLNGYAIGVFSADDLGFILEDNEIILHYGEQIINIKSKSLLDAYFLKQLQKIGIGIKQKGDTYRITYWDEVIDQWVE